MEEDSFAKDMIASVEDGVVRDASEFECLLL